MNITLTGVDEQTSIPHLAELDAEFGLLYSATPEGRHRYPSQEWIITASKQLPRTAIHVCGRTGRAELLAGKLNTLVEHSQRIQINGDISRPDCERVCDMYPHKQIITQNRSGNKELLEVSSLNHTILVDASGGRGISPASWERPNTEKRVGFAGGLGPDNLAQELNKITRVAIGNWWIDMEGKLRVEDWFSLELARQTTAIFKQCMIPA